jgi:hypothetical protein
MPFLCVRALGILGGGRCKSAFVAGNVGLFDYDFVPNHDCRGHGQLHFEVLVRVIFSLGLGGELETWSPFVVDKWG